MGKLLGPRGNSLKRLQEETLTKMSILGKGSMRDKAKVKLIVNNGSWFKSYIMYFQISHGMNTYYIKAN